MKFRNKMYSACNHSQFISIQTCSKMPTSPNSNLLIFLLSQVYFTIEDVSKTFQKIFLVHLIKYYISVGLSPQQIFKWCLMLSFCEIDGNVKDQGKS